MSAQIRHDPAKTERILAVSRELVLSRGVRNVSVSDITDRARIGRGTLYLYWKTKEDLFVELVARDFVAATDEYIDRLAADPGLIRPHRMLPSFVDSALRHPFVLAVQTADVDILGMLGEHEKTKTLLDVLGPGVRLATLVPIWRRHGLARTDRPAVEQEYAMRALSVGYFSLAVNTDAVLHPDVHAETVFADSVRSLVEPTVPVDDPATAAAEARALLIEHRDTVVTALSPAPHANRPPD